MKTTRKTRAKGNSGQQEDKKRRQDKKTVESEGWRTMEASA